VHAVPTRRPHADYAPAAAGLQKQFIDYALSKDIIDLQVQYAFIAYQE
jgi:hypothetical protein